MRESYGDDDRSEKDHRDPFRFLGIGERPMKRAFGWIVGTSLFLGGFAGPAMGQGGGVAAEDEPNTLVESSAEEIADRQESEIHLNVIHLQYQSALETSNMLAQLMHREDDITIVPEPKTNSLYVRATSDSFKQIQQVVETLDQTPVQFEFNVYVLQGAANATKPDWKRFQGESKAVEAQIEQARKAGAIQILDQLKLTTISNEMGEVQFGKQGYTINNRDRAAFGRGATSREIRQTGVVLSVEAQLSRQTGKDIVASVKLEKSWIPATGKDAADEATAGDIETFTMQSTIRIPRDQAVKLGEHHSSTTTATEQVAVIVIGQQKDNKR